MYLNCRVFKYFSLLRVFYLQDIFHSTAHWLQDCGIYRKIAEPYLNAEPLIPLPKVRDNEALGPDQLITLWLIWACGITLGTLAFLLELTSLVEVTHVWNKPNMGANGANKPIMVKARQKLFAWLKKY